ncbi:MAG: hypothetical protein FJW31_26270 [Acidobacteria bacterium]|nr:hypothetical protein [Acidobacteriota bacterium]
MRRLFQTRAFVCALLVVLLGAMRCVQACEWVPAAEQPVKKSCHGSPVPTAPAAPQACSVLLAFDLPPEAAVVAILPAAVSLPAPIVSSFPPRAVFLHLPLLMRPARLPLRI